MDVVKELRSRNRDRISKAAKPAAEEIERMQAALQSIMAIVQDHPLFRLDLFEARDLAALDKVGGDEATFVHIAILAADGLGI